MDTQAIAHVADTLQPVKRAMIVRLCRTRFGAAKQARAVELVLHDVNLLPDEQAILSYHNIYIVSLSCLFGQCILLSFCPFHQTFLCVFPYHTVFTCGFLFLCPPIFTQRIIVYHFLFVYIYTPYFYVLSSLCVLSMKCRYVFCL